MVQWTPYTVVMNEGHFAPSHVVLCGGVILFSQNVSPGTLKSVVYVVPFSEGTEVLS